MKQKSLMMKLLAILTLFVAVIIVRDYWPQANQEADAYLSSWKGFDNDTITSLTVSAGTQEVVVKKEGFVWKVGSFLADTAIIQNVIAGLITNTSSELVAENSATHEKLGLNDTSSKLTVSLGDQRKTVWIGTATGTGRYIRFDGEDKVYLVDNLPASVSSTEINDWVDKKLTAFDEKDIQKIVVEQSRNKVILIQQQGQWFQEGKTVPLDLEPLTPMIRTLLSVTSSGLAEDQDMDLKAPELTITVTTNNGDTILAFSPYQDEQMIATSSSRVGKYLINQSIIDSLKITVADLKPAPTPTPTTTTE